MSTETGFKAFTRGMRSPLQGGAQVWDGSLPFDLPKVALDTSDADCGPGWHFCRKMSDAFRIVGFWPDGRPSIVLLVEPSADVIHRGNKSRASSLKLIRSATAEEITAGVNEFSAVFAPHSAFMVDEQLKWYAALGRPNRRVAEVDRGLREALVARGLDWQLRRFDSRQAAWDARAAWKNARAAWENARAARDAWENARAAWAAWLRVGDATAAWKTRGTRGDAWDAWAAQNALTLGFASRQGWVKDEPLLLTRGLREAYFYGLDVALPTGPNELGWAMVEEVSR